MTDASQELFKAVRTNDLPAKGTTWVMREAPFEPSPWTRVRVVSTDAFGMIGIVPAWKQDFTNTRSHWVSHENFLKMYRPAEVRTCPLR